MRVQNPQQGLLMKYKQKLRRLIVLQNNNTGLKMVILKTSTYHIIRRATDNRQQTTDNRQIVSFK